MPGRAVHRTGRQVFWGRICGEQTGPGVCDEIVTTGEDMLRLYDELKRRNVLRVAAGYLAASWLVVQLIEALLPIFGLAETAGRPLVVFLIVAFLPVLVLTWFFQLTPEGLQSQAALDLSDDGGPRPSGRLDTAIIVMLALAVGYFATDKFVFDPARDRASVATAVEEALTVAPQRSIAVMPFLDLSPARDQAYFSDGLAEELLNLLAKIPDLEVASRTSSFAFKGRNVQIADIADTLSVGHVLEGSVRMSGDRIRVTAQLIRGSDGFHVWSETYDRQLDDIFDVQDDIAGAVVDALSITLLGPAPRPRATDPEAYKRFLQARYLLHQFTPQSLAQALGLMKESLDIDPAYVPAWGNLASIYINQAMNDVMPANEAMELARSAAQIAIDLDPRASDGYSQLAWIAHIYDGDLASAALFYEKAIDLDPENPALLGNAAVLAEALGRLDLAISLKKYLTEATPTNAISHNNLALAYYYAGRLDAAEASIRTTVVLSPGYIGAQYRLGTILLLREEFEAALDAFEREQDEEYHIKGLALAHYALGNREEADTALQTLVTSWGERYPVEVAHVYAYRNETDAAFEWLYKRAEMGGPGSWGDQKLDLLFRNLHDDPRWDDFLVSMDVSDRQLDDISFEVSLPEPPG